MSDNANPFGNEPNTGHIWDDNLRELTNPPPKWWMLGLHASWILVVAYGFIYPMWPLASSYTKGLMGWTSIGEYKADLKALDGVRSKYEDKIASMTVDQIMADPEASEYAVRSAKVLFGDNCAACHGTGGAGNPNFPVLADDDWLYGGTVDIIQTTITNGRKGNMPAMGGQKLTSAEINELATAISKGQPTSTPLFQQKGCFACHGMDGKGMHALGSANLTDGIWRFGDGSVKAVTYTITHGVNQADPMSRNAVMPTWKGRLTSAEIKKLAVYVHQLGGGQ
jgi:cytochrome c oxidase cbb3-type subunit 3